MHIHASAPSNIALIKYMGKKHSGSNLPDNHSLSYTLDNLVTNVHLLTSPDTKDRWEPLQEQGLYPIHLSEKQSERFLQHLTRLKQYFGLEAHFVVRSANNFPHGSGLASSASSFAALSRAVAEAALALRGNTVSVAELAELSRQGSGSSCRSFFSPWALWNDEGAQPINLPYPSLHHRVIVLSGEEKKVSSSEAHQRVKSSEDYPERSARANLRLDALLQALKSKNWASAHTLVWDEFMDMHSLFHTAEEPFSYMTSECKSLLKALEKFWEQEGDGPLVTMDAGPNIHLLYRPESQELAAKFEHDTLQGRFHVL